MFQMLESKRISGCDLIVSKMQAKIFPSPMRAYAMAAETVCNLVQQKGADAGEVAVRGQRSNQYFLTNIQAAFNHVQPRSGKELEVREAVLLRSASHCEQLAVGLMADVAFRNQAADSRSDTLRDQVTLVAQASQAWNIVPAQGIGVDNVLASFGV
jgi:hypothetical protein